jgi:DNA-binding beta-propeller fold protein YncE
MSTRTAFVIALALLAARPIAASAQETAAGYAVAKRIPVGMDGGWDYLTVDTTAGRLYVSHATRVMVVDLARDSVVGLIDSTLGVHGIAVAPELGRGFISDGRDSTVTIFDLRTLARVGRVNVGARNPDAILYEPSTRRVFTFNGGSANSTVLDAATGAVVGTIPLGGKPEFAVHDGAGAVFVNIEDSSQVVALDPRTMQVTARWSVAPCEEPSGLAMDRAARRLFSVCGNRLMAVSDADGHRVLRTLPIGAGVDGAAFDQARGLAFSSNGEGTMTVVREVSRDSFVVAQTVPTQRGARTIALDARTHRLFLPTAEFGPAPAATADNPRPRPSLVPGSFTVLVVGR